MHDYALQLNNQNVAGQELGCDSFVYYVSDDTEDSGLLSESNIRIGPDIDLVEDNVQYPFYVHDSFGTNAFVFGTDLNGVSLRLKEYYDLNNEQSIALYQDDTGELTIQSGPGEYSGEIIFKQSGNQIAKLAQVSTGETYFGLSRSYIRAGFDVFFGNVHVTDTYGIGFYFW